MEEHKRNKDKDEKAEMKLISVCVSESEREGERERKVTRGQFHQHFTSSFCSNLIALKKFKPTM